MDRNYLASNPSLPPSPSPDLRDDSAAKISAFNERYDLSLPKPWTPLMMRWWIVIPQLVGMFLVPLLLEIAFIVTNTRQGWKINDAESATTGLMHYIFTIPPVAIVMTLTTLWTMTDLDLKKIQPYVDLAHGNALAERTLLLDYTKFTTFLVWFYAFRHRHYIVFVSSLMVLAGVGLSPLAAALFTIRDNYSNEGIRPVNGLRIMGLNPDFADMQAAASAAGFVHASSLYNLSQPNFIQNDWVVGQLDTPTDFLLNGTLKANTTSIQSSPGCESPEEMTFSSSDATPVLNGAWKGCRVSFVIDKGPPSQYGSTIATDCSSDANIPLENKPVVFWAYSRPDETASLVFCQPKIAAYNVEITVDLASNLLQTVVVQSNYVVPNNVTGAPLNGQAFNGLGFASTIQDRFVGARSNATLSLLPAAIFQRAARSPLGVSSLFEDGAFPQKANEIYSLFLSLLAKELYFLPSNEPIDASIWAIEKRLWMSNLTTHLLAGILFILWAGGVYVHYFHYKAREPVYLRQEPGSIAFAAAMTAHSLPPELLSSREPTMMEASLRDKRFRSDPVTGSILVDYSSPPHDRNSETEKLLLTRPWSGRS